MELGTLDREDIEFENCDFLWCVASLQDKIFKEVSFVMPENVEPRFGFVDFAETWNGRLAMLGILIGLFTELLTGQSILGQMGIF